MGQRRLRPASRLYAQSVSATESNGVCGQCGSEVSAFVTECPYCGARLRKRAPDLERRGNEIAPAQPTEGDPGKVTRLKPKRRPRLPRVEFTRPWASILTVAASVGLILIAEAGSLDAVELGGIEGPGESTEWWRYLAAPFVYDDAGYLFVCSCAILIFGIAVETRIGSPLAALSIVGCGSLALVIGIAVADPIAAGEADRVWGGNGVALGLLTAWATIRAFEIRRRGEGEVDLIGAVVCAAVLLLLPVVIGPASFFVGLSGAVVGAVLGIAIGAVRTRNAAPNH